MPTEALFPLTLTPFEKYMLADDRDAYPMSYTVQLDFEGVVLRRAWEAALALALTRHPLLTASVHADRAWHWPEADHRVGVRWKDWSEPLDAPGHERIDLSREPGLKVWTQRHDDQTRVTCQGHHACCDFFGLLALMEDWLLAYDAELTGEGQEPAWERVNTEQLATRGAPRWRTPPEPVSRWTALTSMLSETTRWALRRSIPLRAEGTPEPDLGPFPGIQHVTLSREQTQRLRHTARPSGATLNDLLLSSLFFVIRDWCFPNGADRSRRWLTVNVPTNLRLDGDQAMPAANVLGYAFIARRWHECQDGDALLKSIARETQAIKKWNLGQFFLDGLARADRFPGLLSWIASRSRCFATTVLSNLGDVARGFRSRRLHQNGNITAGNLTLEKIVAVPPMRPATRAVFLVSTCQGRLTVCTRCDRRFLDERAANRLLNEYVDTITKCAEGRHCAVDPG